MTLPLPRRTAFIQITVESLCVLLKKLRKRETDLLAFWRKDRLKNKLAEAHALGYIDAIDDIQKILLGEPLP